MVQHEHKIIDVTSGSIASEMGVEPGDTLLEINGNTIEDVLDYRYLIEDDEIVMLIRDVNGNLYEIEFTKSYNEVIGLEFENELMSNYKSCKNNCVFCFVSQMPEDMRDSLYFKDDDYRLSFLQGNFITLTNLSDSDVDRIIRYRLEPLNISVQTMNTELRKNMLRNEVAGESLHILEKLKNAEIQMNAQIVLCKNWNDGSELEYTIEKMKAYLPYLKSLTIVPVGLSKHREGLTEFDRFTKEDAIAIVELVEKIQREVVEQYGYYFIQASDEWYAMAERAVPEANRYDGFTQLENGVGMLRLLEDEVNNTLEIESPQPIRENRIVSIATGTMAYPYIKKLVDKVVAKYPHIHVNIYPIMNDYFGYEVNVAGLITGIDLINQLKHKVIGEKLVLPISMLRTGEKVFLDDLSVTDVQSSLGCSISMSSLSGASFVNQILFDPEEFDEINEQIVYTSLYM